MQQNHHFLFVIPSVASNEADINVCDIKNSFIYSVGGFVPYAAMLNGSNINALFGLTEKVFLGVGLDAMYKMPLSCPEEFRIWL